MVQILYTLLAFASLFVAGLAAPTTETTATKLIQDVAEISAQVADLHDAIVKLSTNGGTPKDALIIHTASVTLDATLKTCGADAKTTPSLGRTDSRTVTTAVVALEGPVTSVVDIMISQKHLVDGLPLKGAGRVVANDFFTLRASTDGLIKNLLQICALSDATALRAFQIKVDVVLEQGIMAYSK